MEPDRVCYQWECMKYPQCLRARGKGCSLEWVDDKDFTDRSRTVQKDECGDGKGYPFFLSG